MIPTPEEVFMTGALLQGTRGTCNRIKVGVVIVKNNRIVSSGYNDSPEGEQNCLEAGCLISESGSCIRTIHAEIMAIHKTPIYLLNQSDLYCTIPPCPKCAKVIIDARIKRVFYHSWYPKSEVSIQLLEDHEIRATKLEVSTPNWFGH